MMTTKIFTFSISSIIYKHDEELKEKHTQVIDLLGQAKNL
ncbi:Transcriptional regulator [Bacillus pseudomycoides]